MIPSNYGAGLLIQLQDADTVFVQARDAWDIVVGLSAAVMGFTAFVFLVALTVILFQIRNAVRGVQKVKDKVGADPGVQRLRSVAENVDYMTHALRSDVKKLSGTVSLISDRLDHASNRIEERLEDFNALIEVLQHEAEDVLLDTASTVRGVKAGARRFQSRQGRRSKPRPPLEAGRPDGTTPAEDGSREEDA